MSFVSIWYENVGTALRRDPELLSGAAFGQAESVWKLKQKSLCERRLAQLKGLRHLEKKVPPLKGHFLSPRYHKNAQALKPGIICGIAQR